jgi:hypothetical protein
MVDTGGDKNAPFVSMPKIQVTFNLLFNGHKGRRRI